MIVTMMMFTVYCFSYSAQDYEYVGHYPTQQQADSRIIELNRECKVEIE